MKTTDILKILENCSNAQIDFFDINIKNFVSQNYESPIKVVISALCVKLHDPSCDTRYHQKSNGGKYCLRSIEQHTTQWCASKDLFTTNCVGSLSNALRHKEPYDNNYSRVWKSSECKSIFLNIFEAMNADIENNYNRLVFILNCLQEKSDKHKTCINACIETKSIELYPLLCNLCSQFYNKSSVIPVIIAHTYYQVIKHEGLISLKHHNSPDIKGKSYGDIEVWNKNNPEIVIEIKHGLEIKEAFLQTFSSKVKNMKTKNYLLTSLPYQRYDYNVKYNIVCWNVASYIHYNLYNTHCVNEYIELLHNNLMQTNIELKHKENLKNFFHI